MDMRVLVFVSLLTGVAPLAHAQEQNTPFATAPLWSVPASLTHSDSLAIAVIFEHRQGRQKQGGTVPDWMDRFLAPFMPRLNSDSTATDCILPDEAMIAEPSSLIRPTLPVLEASPTLDPHMVMNPCTLISRASSPRN